MKAVIEDVFGQVDQQEVRRFTLENDAGYQVVVMNYGATLLEYVTPDRDGQMTNIVLGFSDFPSYVGNSPRFGASIGPVAGRIAGAAFDLKGHHYSLEANNGTNHLHGGTDGFESQLFLVDEVTKDYIRFYCHRPDGKGGYPGNLDVWITYSLFEDGQLHIDYRVETDQDTLVNPTNHAYFNLSGDFRSLLDDQILTLNQDGYYPIDENSLPIEPIDSNASFLEDLRKGVSFQEIFHSDHPQLKTVGGLDHPFHLDPSREFAGEVYHAESGRRLRFQTDASHLVLYTANVYDEQTKIDGHAALIHNGLAIECQELPNAIHGSNPQAVILPAGKVFTSQTIYHATADKESEDSFNIL